MVNPLQDKPAYDGKKNQNISGNWHFLDPSFKMLATLSYTDVIIWMLLYCHLQIFGVGLEIFSFGVAKSFHPFTSVTSKVHALTKAGAGVWI